MRKRLQYTRIYYSATPEKIRILLSFYPFETLHFLYWLLDSFLKTLLGPFLLLCNISLNFELKVVQ